MIIKIDLMILIFYPDMTSFAPRFQTPSIVRVEQGIITIVISSNATF